MDKKVRTVNRATYETIVQLLKGEFKVPVRDRSTEQKNAIVRCWRHRQDYTLEGDTVLYRGKRLLCEEDAASIVAGEFVQTKRGSGRSDAIARLCQNHAGLNKSKIKVLLKQSKNNPAKSTEGSLANRAPLIVAIPQQCHVIDVFEVQCVQDERYRCVLAVVDVFSWFVWLRPLEGKNSEEIAKELTAIYQEHGPPKNIRYAQFHDIYIPTAIEQLNVRLGTTIQHATSETHPLEEEKGCHELRTRLYNDLTAMEVSEACFADRLRDHQRKTNIRPKSQLGFKSAFEMYYGRPCNANSNIEYASELLRTSVLEPSSNHALIKDCGNAIPNENSFAAGIHSSADKSADGTPLFKGVRVKIEHDDWFDPSDKTGSEDSEHHVQTPWFMNSGLHVRLNPQPDGNCQFVALSDQLASVGKHLSASALRREIIEELRNDPYTSDATHMSAFVENGDWDTYLNNMELEGTYGDELTLRAAARLFHVQLLVLSTLGEQGTRVVSPSGGYSPNFPLLCLGHFHEQEGEHYVSLSGALNTQIVGLRHLNMASSTNPLPLGGSTMPGRRATYEQPGVTSSTNQSPLGGSTIASSDAIYVHQYMTCKTESSDSI